jgi:hypothetical protein
MPFTLAHPAAVLPLRRYCPRYLSFSALVVGSVTPDAGYCFTRFGWDQFSHSVAGSFVFCLPVGILMLAALYLFRGPLVERLPERRREVFRPLCGRPRASPLVLLVSLLLGSWTHLAWDSFTHKKAWLVLHVPWLRTPIATQGYRTLEVCQVIGLACSIFGVAVLCYAYEKWLMSSRAVTMTRAAAWRNALLAGLLVLPIEILHLLVINALGYALVGVCSLALVLAMALKIGNAVSEQPAE